MQVILGRERGVRITTSRVGTLAKMKEGTLMEDTSRNDYKTYQEEHGHAITTHRTGVVISSKKKKKNPWLTASPNDQVHVWG